MLIEGMVDNTGTVHILWHKHLRIARKKKSGEGRPALRASTSAPCINRALVIPLMRRRTATHRGSWPSAAQFASARKASNSSTASWSLHTTAAKRDIFRDIPRYWANSERAATKSKSGFSPSKYGEFNSSTSGLIVLLPQEMVFRKKPK